MSICSITHLIYNVYQDTVSDDTSAAGMDMFGIMTRQISQWHPHRMLCRRFNIPNPYPQLAIQYYTNE